MKTPLALTLLIATLGCLPPKRQVEFEAGLNRWVGRPISAFIAANGLPTTSADRTGGDKVYLFARSRSQPVSWNYTEYTNFATGQRVVQGAASQPPAWMNDGGAQWVRVRDRSFDAQANFYCRIHLETDAEEIIRAVRYEGNDCW